jgi:PDZ domain-containing secreted protein/Zn-dependent protease/CBS domain-containing protein
MNSSFTLVRVRGIAIGANWSWLFVFGLIIWQLATGVFPESYPGLASSSYWVMGALTGVIFFVSLLLHELGHAFRAQKEGMEIEGITLWILGGVAKFKGNFPSAGAEFRIAIAGPLVTVVLAIVFAAMWLGMTAAGAPDVVVGVPNYLWQINTTLLVFNMIPALPLDGGRVLRSALWYFRKNFAAATATAGSIARVFAAVMIAAGAWIFLYAGPGNGVILGLVGYFLMQASRAEEAYAMFRQSLGGVRVRDLMTPFPETVIPSRTIESFLSDVAHMRGHSTYPVVDLDGTLVGLASLRLAAGVPYENRSTTSVRDVMLPVGAFPVLHPDEEISQVLPQLQRGPGRAVVMDDGRVVGLVSMADVARALELEQIRDPSALGAARAGRRSRRGIIIIAAIAALVFAALAYSPPFVILAPGTAFDVTKDIRIKGVETDDVAGKYLLTSVAVQQPKLIGLVGAMASGKEVTPLSAVVPNNVDPEEYFKEQEKLFKESQEIAAAAAAKAAGFDVELEGDGAEVADVRPDSPASRSLEDGDVITRIDGATVKLADDVVRRIRSRPSGTTFVLTIKRDNRSRTVRVRSERGIVPGAPGIGLLLQTKNLDVNLPFDVTFRQREIGGPSAGLSYALAVYDLITPKDVARGRVVACTGTIDLDGRVGPIGGIEEKAVAAERKNADVFLVPEEEVNEVSDAKGAGLDVRGVGTLKDAIEFLSAKA